MPSEDGTTLALRASRLLLRRRAALGMPDLNIVTQRRFVREVASQPGLSLAERQRVLRAIERTLREVYVHYHFKRQFFSMDPNANPLLASNEIRRQLATLSDVDFHTCMLLLLSGARDVHTSYTAPSPWRGAVSFLPFQLRFFEEVPGERHYVVARTTPTSADGTWDHPNFRPGAEILSWNGLLPDVAALSAAQLQPGAHEDAARSRGVSRLTVRALGNHGLASPGGIPPFPIENRVSIIYRSADDDEVREISFPWQVARNFGAVSFSSTALFSQSEAMYTLQHWGKCSYRPEKLAVGAAEIQSDFFEARLAGDEQSFNAPSPELLRNPGQPDLPFGYLRIRNFAGSDPAVLEDSRLQEVRAAVERFDREARGGLIIDIRGNPGGQIRLAERMLQFFSPRAIEPLRFHFARTPLIQSAFDHVRRYALQGTEFAPWLSVEPDDEADADTPLTHGRPLTPVAAANDTGQIYHGPVVLLIDALTYSAADMFAAGFQDHAIGEVIGVDASTGGGGANAWSYSEIRENVASVAGRRFPKLPTDCGLNVAVRRCHRVRADRKPIEDFGIEPDLVYARTRNDVLGGNQDLFAFACGRLVMRQTARIDIQEHRQVHSQLEVRLVTKSADWICIRQGTVVLAQGSAPAGQPTTFTCLVDTKHPEEFVRVEGWTSREELERNLPLKAVRRIPLTPDRPEFLLSRKDSRTRIRAFGGK